jgi:predicted patatin/cPLA2 family phospholipase
MVPLNYSVLSVSINIARFPRDIDIGNMLTADAVNPLSFVHFHLQLGVIRVSFETSFDSKQPKLEPKLVSALSETERLFRLFRFYTKTESFDVSIEPKQTEDQPKQFDKEHILQFFTAVHTHVHSCFRIVL